MADKVTISPGVRVTALNARGERNERVALTGLMMGRDFPVIWVCDPAEWMRAQAEGRLPEGVPWPAEDVWLREDAPGG